MKLRNLLLDLFLASHRERCSMTRLETRTKESCSAASRRVVKTLFGAVKTNYFSPSCDVRAYMPRQIRTATVPATLNLRVWLMRWSSSARTRKAVIFACPR